MRTRLRIVNYIGDYGPANFWQNITKQEVDKDLLFFKQQNFNAIILMVPYAAFKPDFNSFDNKYSDILNYILNSARQNELKVIARLGYLWESEFIADRTFERYTDIISCFRSNQISKYEQDYLDYIDYYCNYDFFHIMISWEDFYWPISWLYKEKIPYDICAINKEFVEYLLSKIKNKTKIHVQQKNSSIICGSPTPINHDSKTHYTYYNSLSLKKAWYENSFQNMLLEKIFIEWYSIIYDKLNLKSNKLIIDQFNIIDNTFNDDEYHSSIIDFDKNSFHGSKINPDDFERSMRIISLIAPKILDGVGVWALCDTISGQVFNGTFKFGVKGWETNGYFYEQKVKLEQSQFISSNLAYVRISNSADHYVLIHASSNKKSELVVTLGNIQQTVLIDSNNKIKLKFKEPSNKMIKIECSSGAVDISRIDCYDIELKSLMFDSERRPKETHEGMKLLFDSMVP